jgi:hypothetical protein
MIILNIKEFKSFPQVKKRLTSHLWCRDASLKKRS